MRRAVATFKPCPVCGASVKVENLKRHAARAHPGRKVDFELTEEEEAAVQAARPRRPRLGGRQKLLYPLAALAVVVVLVVAAFVALSPPAGPEGVAPDFVLQSDDGGSVHLADLQGRVVLLDFMDVDCSHCRSETANVLVPLHAQYGGQVTFLSVNVGFVGGPDTLADILAFKAAYGATWTYLLDDGSVAGPSYGVQGTPTTFILGRDLTIQGAPFVGETPYETLAAALQAALEA